MTACQQPIHGNAVYSNFVIPTYGGHGRWTQSACHLGCWKNGRKKGLQHGLERAIAGLEKLSDDELSLLRKRFDDTVWTGEYTEYVQPEGSLTADTAATVEAAA